MKIVSLTSTSMEISDLSSESVKGILEKMQPFCPDILIDGDRFTVIGSGDNYVVLSGSASSSAILSAKINALSVVTQAPLTLEQRMARRVENAVGLS